MVQNGQEQQVEIPLSSLSFPRKIPDVLRALVGLLKCYLEVKSDLEDEKWRANTGDPGQELNLL